MVATPPFCPETVLRRVAAALPMVSNRFRNIPVGRPRRRIGLRVAALGLIAAWASPLSHATTRTYHFDATVTGTAAGDGTVAASSISNGDVFYVEYSFDDTQTDSQASTSQGSFANAALTLEVRRGGSNVGTWTGAQGGVTIGNRLIQTSTGPGTFSFRPQSLTGAQNVTVTGGTLPGSYTMTAARFDHLVTVNDTGSGQQLGAQVTNPFTPTGHGTATMTFGPATVTVSISNFASGGHPQYAPYLSVGGIASTYTAGSAAVVIAPNLVLTGPNINGSRMNISTGFNAAGDRLGIVGQGTATSGTLGTLSWSYDTVTGILAFTGTTDAATMQSALRSVVYYNTQGSPVTGTRAIAVSVGSLVSFSSNGHFYEAVDAGGNITWTAAKAAAEARTYFGLKGYLVTITSAAENQFSFGKINAVGWIGASDTQNDKQWRWVGGPEAGQVFFYQGGYVPGGPNTAGTGAAATQPAGGPYYSNWSTGEPNDYSDGQATREDYAHFLSDGKWNDYPNSLNVTKYLVEYGGMAGDPTVSLTGNTSVNVTAASANLNIAMSGPSPALTVGQNSTYTFTVTNVSTTTAATSATVKYAVPAGLDVISTSGTGWTFSPASGSSPVGTITATYSGSIAANNGTSTFTVVVRPTVGGSKTNYYSIDPLGGTSPPTPTLSTGQNQPSAGSGAPLTSPVTVPPPVIAADSGAVNASEGSPVSNTGTFSDILGNAAVTITSSLGTITKNDTNGTWSWSYTPPDGPLGPTTVTVTATDNSAPPVSSTATFSLTVANVAPSLAVTNSTSNNTAYYVNWTAANPAAGTASGTITLGDGSTIGVQFTAQTSGGGASFFYGAQVSGGTNFWNPTAPYISTQVPNAPPDSDIIQLSGGSNTIYRVTFTAAIQDPIMALVSLGNNANPITYDFDSPFTIVSQGVGYWGGSANALTQQPGDVLRGAEGHGTIKFLGSYSTFSWTVPVAETWHGFTFAVRTSAALASTVTVNEGQTAQNDGTWSDPGDDVVTLSASIGTVVKNANGTWNWSYPTTDGPAETQTVTITATDSDGAVTTTTFPLVVNNVAPAATFANGGSVPEGSTGSVSFSGLSDASGDLSAGMRYSYDFNNDGVFETGDGTYAGSSASATATVPASYLADGPGSRVVRGRVIDKDGATHDYTTSISITNVAPSFELGSNEDLTPPDAGLLTRVVSFTDPGTDTWTATVDWGDGAGPQPLTVNGAGHDFTLSHVYATEGPRTVTVTLLDDDGGSFTDSFSITVDLNTPPTIELDPPGRWHPMASGGGSLIGTSDGRTINAAWFASATEGWVVGQDGMIRRTLDGGTTWTIETTGFLTALNGLWGADATHVWAVGDNGLILFWNGTNWTQQTSGTTVELRGVWGTGINSVWVAGYGGTILKWSGASWASQSSETTADFRWLTGVDASHIWAVGGSGKISFWNGSTWAAQTSGTTQNLNCVWAANATNIWAVGNSGTILKSNGASWTVQTSPSAKHLRGVWGSSASDVWIVGYSGTMLRGSTSWTQAPQRTTENLNAVFGLNGNLAWAGGYGGVVLGWGGTSWQSLIAAPYSTELRAIWGLGTSEIWATGLSGTILKWNGTVWTPQSSGTTQGLIGVWGSDSNHVWAVGGSGTIRAYNGAAWTSQASGTTQNLTAVWGTDASHVWVVGWKGTILHFNGTAWTSQTSGTMENLFGIWGTGAGNIWAVGNSGTILHFNGTAWSSVTSPGSAHLFAIHGLNATRIWAAGYAGAVYSWDGTAWTAGQTGASDDLRGVWAESPTSVYVSGLGGIIRHWNGAGWLDETTNTSLDRRAVWGADGANVFNVGTGSLIQKRTPGVAGTSAVTINEGEPAVQTGTFNDAEGRATATVTATKGGLPFGSIVQNNTLGAWAWTGPVTLNGPSQGGTITVTVTDNESASDSRTFPLVVRNLAPTPVAQVGTTTVDTPLDLTLTGTDPGNDALSFQIASLPTHGTLWQGATPISSAPLTLAGAGVRYIPSVGYLGPDSFTFKAIDADGATSSSTAQVTLAVNASAGPPPAPLMLAAVEGAGSSLTIAGGTLVGASSTTDAGGSITVNGQTLTYVPPAGLVGDDSLTYMVTDGDGVSTVNRISVNVTPVGSRRPGLALQADRSAALTFLASPGQNYWVQSSPDLVNWSNLAVITADRYTGLATFTAPASGEVEIFYRLTRAPATPAGDE